MHPVAFKKAMLEAFLAGAEAMAAGDIDVPSKKEAREWFENDYGLIVTDEKCDCCDDDGDS
jgi:disulfide oxidoreductase YuzD